jgi:hypothetical protein
MCLGNSPDRRCGFVVNGPDVEPLPVRICDLRCAPEAPFAQTEANARLIAAAPDLLCALSDCADELAAAIERATGPENAANRYNMRKRAEQARAAISKATQATA